MTKKQITLTDLPGVGAATAEKLTEAGFDSLMALAVATPAAVAETAGVSEAVARKIINTARNSLDMGFESGLELYEKRLQVERISTGSKGFDAMIGGGIETGAITECYGAYGSGKCAASDTPVLYFNSRKPHLQQLSQIYEKYKNIHGEKKHDDGFVVETPEIKVMGLQGNHLQQTNASMIYREHVDTIYEIRTERGRKLRITGPHKLLSFKEGLHWVPAGALKEGDPIAYPKILLYEGEKTMDNDDAYFLGLYVAEGGGKAISNSDVTIVSWLKKYIEHRFGYISAVYEDRRREDICYNISLRKIVRSLLGNLYETTAGTKYIPEEVLLGNKEVITNFLAGYFDGDAHCPENGTVELSTKSEILAHGLSYLLLRLGVPCTASQKTVNGDLFHRLFISGKQREILNALPFKLKKANYRTRNSKYGYPLPIIEHIVETYRNALGSNRGKMRKKIGKRSLDHYSYDVLTNRASVTNVGEETLLSIKTIFEAGLENIQLALKLANNLPTLSKEEFKELHDLLPMAFNMVSEKLGLKKTTMSNYTQRGIPQHDAEKIGKIKEFFIEELTSRKEILSQTIKNITNSLYFLWDTVVEVAPVKYNDYVYDMVVPEGHLFVGGNMPTILHNTSLAHQLAVNVQLPKEQGGASGIAVWIDTEGTLRPEYMKPIAVAKGLDPEEALKNFRGVRAFNSDHQMLLAEKVEDLIKKDKLPVKLIIVDSLMGHFRSEFAGRGTLADRQQKLNKHMHALLKLATQYNLAIYLTNQVMSKPDTFFGDPTEAIGGHIVAHTSTVRVYLRRGKKGTRVAKLVDAPALPDAECTFIVTNEGIKDVTL